MNLNLDIENCLKALNNNGIILYPTDTIWGLGCDATNEQAIRKIFTLKKREENKSMIILVNNQEMLERFVINPPSSVFEYYENESRPTTFIFENAQNLPEVLVGKDCTIAIRIPKNPFCLELINRLGKPIVSTSANISHENFPQNFSEIVPEIKNGVDYIVQHRQNDFSKKAPSSIIKINTDGEWEKIR